MTVAWRAATWGDMRGRWWRWLRRGVAGLGVVLLVAVVTGWLMFQHIPSWYEPVEIPPAELQSVRDNLVATVDGLSHAMANAREPFEYRFTQDQLNAWIAAREAIWPMSREWLPEEVRDPFVVLQSTGVRLAATFHHAGFQTVASLCLDVRATERGITMRLRDVAGGVLSVPERWVREELARLDRDVWPVGKRLNYQSGPGRLPTLSSLFEGVVFPNGWKWQNPKRRFRVTGLQFLSGEVVVRFAPEPF